MGIVRVSDELGLLFDPLKGTIAETREDVIQYALDPLYPRIERLDHIADDLVNQLAPDAELMESYAHRGKCFLHRRPLHQHLDGHDHRNALCLRSAGQLCVHAPGRHRGNQSRA